MEINLPEEYKNEPMILCLRKDPSPVAYVNVYEEGDVWLKVKGCESCPEDTRKKCCSRCPMFSTKGCYFHLEMGADNHKPYKCVIKPFPDSCFSFCNIAFKCVQGSYEGKIRKVSKPSDVFE